MTRQSEEQQNLARRVRAMYNAHPFPNREIIPERRSDERFRYIYEEFLRLPLNQLANKTLFDAGCGTGENTWSWRRLLDPTAKVVAIDHSQASIIIARDRSTEALRPLFALSSLLDLGLAENSVDVVFCSGVLVAVTDPNRAFRELVRVLKPGGYMVLILYHRYGRAIHGFQRAVIDFLEPEDIDRRAHLGKQLFGSSMRKLADEEQTSLEGVLYDQFGLPCETRYSVGDALTWFRQANIRYLGTWPPVEWSQLGKGLRFSHYFAPYREKWLGRMLLKLFPHTQELPQTPPGFFTRATMQFMWTLNQLQLFAIAWRKESSNRVSYVGDHS